MKEHKSSFIKGVTRAQLAGCLIQLAVLLALIGLIFWGLLSVFGFFWNTVLKSTVATIVITEEDLVKGEDLVQKSREGFNANEIIKDGLGLALTESELDARGALLTDYEKNLYRLVMLSRDAVRGFGGTPYNSWAFSGDEMFRVKFVLGITSTETSMEFYVDPTGKNILRDPSDIPPNQWGYGMLGVSKDHSLSMYLNSDAINGITNKYVPAHEPSYPAAYIPYGVAMAVGHLRQSISAYLDQSRLEPIFNKVLDDYGILNEQDRGFSKEFFAHAILQAQFHGNKIKYHEAICGFLGAFIAATKDDGGRINLDKWAIDLDNYSESSFRKLLYGSVIGERLHFVGLGSVELGSVRGTLKLDGQALGVPLLRFLHEKYRGVPAYDIAERDILHLSQIWESEGGSPVGEGVMLINFHYGLNSYLQGSRIVRKLGEKMGVAGEFVQTKGRSQGLYAGMVLNDYINSRGTEAQKKWARSFSEAWGTAVYITEQTVGGVSWKPSKWGVPHYFQGVGNNAIEEYSNMKWGVQRTFTFGYTGCMLYSCGYTASALLGKLINPAEIASALYVNGGIDPSIGLMYQPTLKTFEDMGLKAELLNCSSNANIEVSWNKILAEVTRGDSVAILYVHGTNDYGWTAGSYFGRAGQHFIVLEGVEVVNGVVKLDIYSSNSLGDSIASWDASVVKPYLKGYAILVKRR